MSLSLSLSFNSPLTISHYHHCLFIILQEYSSD
nr:MAG TPA: hypothetical protein [Caudoviricetes sp.]